MKELLKEVKDLTIKCLDFIEYCESNIDENINNNIDLRVNTTILVANIDYLYDYIRDRYEDVIRNTINEFKERDVTYSDFINADIILPEISDDKEESQDILKLGNYKINIKNIELVESNYTDENIILVNFEFENNGNKPESFDDNLKLILYQNGIELERLHYCFIDTDEYKFKNIKNIDNEEKKVRPGYKIELAIPYALENDNDILFELRNWSDQVDSISRRIKY